jgi:hypothetical protein
MGQDTFPIRMPHDTGVLATPHWVVGETPAWLGHVPFAFWVVSATEPRVIVELGCHYGNSYFAFAQSVRACGLGTSMFAIDTWVGDDHSGIYGSEVFDAVHGYNEKTYPTFSQLIRSTFDDACDHFEDGSIDLLHIDGHHTYEAVRQDFESWLPKMSERGIVLFHDIAVRERGFGVHRLWNELTDRYESFGFEHSHGLGVVAVGSEIPDGLRSLLALDPNSPDAVAARRLFATLGRKVNLEVTLEGQIAEVKDAADQRLAAVRVENADALDAVRVENADALDAVRTGSVEELDAQRADAAAAMEGARQAHVAAMAALQDDFDRTRAALQIEVDLARQRAATVFDERLNSLVSGENREQ